MSEHPSESELAELAIAVYIEELATDKRVLCVGDPQSRSPERLAKVARSVDLLSPQARARGTRRGGRVQARRWPEPGDESRWDLIVVADLGSAGLDRPARVEEVRGWLADGGVLVAAIPEPSSRKSESEGLTYEAFFDLLQGIFDSVRMVGQAPFRGFSLVDFQAGGEPDVTFDGSLLEGTGQSAQCYLALCAGSDVVLDAYAVVQTPMAAPAPPPAQAPSGPDLGPRVSELTERLRDQQDALDAANVHAEELERALKETRTAVARAEQQLEEGGSAQAEVETLRKRVATLEREHAAGAVQGHDQESVRLESSLFERARELTVLRAELARRATLVRDLIEEKFSNAAALARPAEPDEARRALVQELPDDRVGAQAELSSRLDEVRGQLAMAESKASHDKEELQRLEARLRGTVRGLNARLAEVTELYQLTQARLELASDDHRMARGRVQELERELAEAREQLELEFARAQTTRGVQALAQTVPPAPGKVLAKERDPHDEERTLAEREGQLLGALMRCRDEATDVALQKRTALDEVELLGERLEGMRYGYQTRIAELGSELDALRAEANAFREKLAERGRTEASLRGELAGAKLRLADREEAVAALRDRAGDATSAGDVRADLERPRSSAPPGAGSDEVVDGLRAMLSARDGMIARLQNELGHAAERHTTLEAAREQVESAKVVADFESEEGMRELGELTTRLEDSEDERAGAVDALRDTKGILTTLIDSLSNANGGDSAAMDADVALLRERLGRLDAEAADREVLLRSLTSQLEGRDDRIRALEREIDAKSDG